jgi:quinol monooxygenase YgiN
MSGHLTLFMEYTLKPDRRERFRELIRTAFVPHVQLTEPGLRLYQWYESPDGTRVYQQSWYDNADDFVAHMTEALESDRFAKLLELCDVTRVEVFGQPGPDAASFLAGHKLVVHRYFAGFARASLGSPDQPS